MHQNARKFSYVWKIGPKYGPKSVVSIFFGTLAASSTSVIALVLAVEGEKMVKHCNICILYT